MISSGHKNSKNPCLIEFQKANNKNLGKLKAKANHHLTWKYKRKIQMQVWKARRVRFSGPRLIDHKNHWNHQGLVMANLLISKTIIWFKRNCKKLFNKKFKFSQNWKKMMTVKYNQILKFSKISLLELASSNQTSL